MNCDISSLMSPVTESPLKRKGDYLTDAAGNIFPIVNNIPRFVDANNYCADFGYQWKMFSKTQLDSFTGLDITRARLERCFQGCLPNIKDKLLLEAGSGAGRFTEQLLKCGAIVHSFDFSTAVEANASNNGLSDRLTLVQADIRKIPFRKDSYDYVVCLGVIQHTPRPEESIESLWKMVKPGGFLIADHYIFKWRIVLPPPFGQALGFYRQLALQISRSKRFHFVKRLTDFWFPIHWRFRDSWILTRILRRLSPVIFHYPSIQLRDREMHYNWSLLDTHDSTTDYYKHYRTPRQIRRILESLGATDIVISEGGNGIEFFCKKTDH